MSTFTPGAPAPHGRFSEVVEAQTRRWSPMRERLGAEARRTFDDMLHRARRLTSAAPGASAPDDAATLLLAVLTDLEAEVQRLMARVAWLEQEADYQNAIRRALAPADPMHGPRRRDDEPESFHRAPPHQHS